MADYISGKEARKILDIKSQTLYAYVSRGMIRTQASPADFRRRLYCLSDIETLLAKSQARQGHGPVAASSMRWGDPILDSAITAIRADDIWYRGYSMRNLIRQGRTFEDVAELLWSGVLAQQRIRWPLSRVTKISGGYHHLSPGTTVAGMRLALSAYTAMTPVNEGTLDIALTRARSLISVLAQSVGSSAAGPKLSRGLSNAVGIAEQFLRACGIAPDDSRVGAVNCALIAIADHELNASTFAARVAASTGASLDGCFFAGLGALEGLRHGAAVEGVVDFINSLRSVGDAAALIKSTLAQGQMIPSFGHKLYPEGDPRFEPVYARAMQLKADRKSQRALAKIRAVIGAARGQSQEYPTIDWALVALAIALGLPTGGAFALFALGRSAGWVAHVLEQRQQNFMLRPRARYTGRALLIS